MKRVTHSLQWPKTLVACLLTLSFSAAWAADPLPEPIRMIEAKGVTISGAFEAPGGLRGYAGHVQGGDGITLYLTPDGQHVLIGTLVDAKGNDLSMAPLEKLVYGPQSKTQWAQLEKSTWIADGQDNAPRIIYVFSDPNCPYCNKFWQLSRPWVSSGKVQLRHIMVGILGDNSVSKAAALFASADPKAALQAHESNPKAGKLKPLNKIPPAIQKKLDDNLALMENMNARATPAVVYLNERGIIQVHQGVPQGNDITTILGPQ